MITLKHKEKSIDAECPDWIILLKPSNHNEDGRITFSAHVTYKKSNMHSNWFNINYHQNGLIYVDSDGYGFDIKIKENLTNHKKIIIEALKIPILVGVMYQQGVNRYDAYEHMNKLLGNKIWKK